MHLDAQATILNKVVANNKKRDETMKILCDKGAIGCLKLDKEVAKEKTENTNPES